MRRTPVGVSLKTHPHVPTNSSKEILCRRPRLRPGRGELLFGKTDQLLKPRGILDRHIG
jgi:hypothetical protein